MPFVRSRATKAGTISTALVESYRDEKGKPRQRTLANLHGAPDPMHALAKLAAQRDRLRKERAELEPDIPHLEKFCETVTLATLNGHVFSPIERKEANSLLEACKRLLKRIEEIDSRLAQIQKDGATIKRYCTASPDEIRAAVREYTADLKPYL
jgi:hypothetical protein